MLLTAVALSGALGACTQIDNLFYGARDGTVEYPGSGAGANATTTYIVKDKDTVDSISQRFGLSTQAVIDRNKLAPPYTLRSGQALELVGARPEAAPPENTTREGTGRQEVTVKREGLPPPPQQGDPPRSAAPSQPVPLTPAATTTATAPPPGPKPNLQWPLKGKIISGYGPGPNGQKNDGIDIQADKGTPVKAADGGSVIYASDGPLARLGNLLLIEHTAGYITAYANNEALLVKKGDVVKKGQTIARVGDTGGVPSPRLHFEVRRGGNIVIDPMKMLPAQ